MDHYDGNGSTLAVAEHPSAAYLDATTAAHNLNALKMRHNLMVGAMRDVLREDIDYGKIPGTGNKPTLLKAGAENLSFLFGLRPSFELVDSIEDWDGGLFYYRYRCTLNDGAGRIVANSEGSCNNREVKYRYRTSKQICPECGADSISRSKYPPRGAPRGTPNGWWCRDCKTDYAHNDKRITDQERGKIENPEPYELVNTLQKMAQKRALVAAVLVGTGASQFFTQDVEDMTTIAVDAAAVREIKPAQPTTTPKPASPEPPTTEGATPDADLWDQEERETQDTAGDGGSLSADLPLDAPVTRWTDFQAYAVEALGYEQNMHFINALRKDRGTDKTDIFWKGARPMIVVDGAELLDAEACRVIWRLAYEHKLA